MLPSFLRVVTVSELPHMMKGPKQTANFVILIEGKRSQATMTDFEIPEEAQRALRLIQQELPLKKAAALVAQLYDLKKNTLYQWAISEARDSTHTVT